MEALAGRGRAATGAQIAAAHQLAGALEAGEAHFLALAGDPAFHPMQRTHFPIGKLLAAVKSHQDVYDTIAEQWALDGSRGAPLAQVRSGPALCDEKHPYRLMLMPGRGLYREQHGTFRKMRVHVVQRVAGMRLLLACLAAWGADSYPLSDDGFLSRVMRWAMAEETAGKAPAVRCAEME